MARRAWWSLAAPAIALVALWSAALFLAPARRGLVLLVLGLDLAAGREASIPAALAAELPWPSAGLLVTLLQWSYVLALAPILLAAGGRLRGWGPLRGIAETGDALAKRFPQAGVFSLAGLAVFPFLPIGALTALLAGRVLGVPALRLLAAILAAQAVANTLWALAASRALALLPDPRLGAALVAAGFVAVAVASWWAKRRRTSM